MKLMSIAAVAALIAAPLAAQTMPARPASAVPVAAPKAGVVAVAPIGKKANRQSDGANIVLPVVAGAAVITAIVIASDGKKSNG